MLNNFHLENNQSKDSFDDQSEQQSQEIIQPRRSDRKRRASKLVEKMIQYDSQKKMPRADMITIKNKFAYKKILKCLTHMTRVLATLTVDQFDESQTFKDAMQRSDWSEWHDVIKRKFNSLVENQTWDLVRRSDINQQVIIERWIYKLKKNRDDNLIRYKVR